MDNHAAGGVPQEKLQEADEQCRATMTDVELSLMDSVLDRKQDNNMSTNQAAIDAAVEKFVNCVFEKVNPAAVPEKK